MYKFLSFYLLISLESTLPESSVVTVNMENRQPSAVLVKFYTTQSLSSGSFASLLVDAKSTRQALLKFPKGVSSMKMKAYRLDQLLMVNGQYVYKLTPGTPGQIAHVVIQSPGKLIIFFF